MYLLIVEESFDAAHFLLNYDGKCKNLHGHRWRIVLRIEEEITDDVGMSINFADLKKNLKNEVDYFDHCLIYQMGSLKQETINALEDEKFVLREVKFRPTAENIAYYFFEQMQNYGYCVESVSVYETPNNCAIYRKER